MMKILTITNSYGANGAAALLRNISHYWIKELGWSVDALATNPVSQPDQELIKAAGICFLGDKAYLRPYDIVLINTLVDLQLIDKIPTTVRVVVWAHEGVSIAYNVDWSARQWHNKLARARLIIFQTKWQTETVYKSFLFNLPSSKVRIIPNGILPISHHGRLGRELGQKVKVVFVGAMTPLKQPLDLAKAIVNLRKKTLLSQRFS
jgi:glycosyltransferase involved in cell wall biosynthesis